jgi:hypothetical protein
MEVGLKPKRQPASPLRLKPRGSRRVHTVKACGRSGASEGTWQRI